MSVVKRIKQYSDYKSISVSVFEKSIGMSNASFGKSVKTGGAIGSDKLEKFLKIYPEVNPTWLLTGDGEMIRTDDPQPQKNVEPTYIYRENPDKDEIIQLQREQIQLLKEKLANFKKVSTGYVPTPPTIPAAATPDVEAVSVTRIIEHSEEPSRRRP